MTHQGCAFAIVLGLVGCGNVPVDPAGDGDGLAMPLAGTVTTLQPAQAIAKCLDITSNSSASGASLQQYGCGGGANQNFKFIATSSGYYMVQAQNSNLCLYASGVQGAALVQKNCDGSAPVLFTAHSNSDGTGTISLIAKNGFYVGIAQGSTGDRAQAVQWVSSGTAEQKFKTSLPPTPSLPATVSGGQSAIVVRSSGQCFEVDGVMGHGVVQNTCAAGAAKQNFQFSPTASGAYAIKAVTTGQCLGIAAGSTAQGAGLIQWPCDDSPSQAFTYQSKSDGTASLVANQSTQCLAIPGGSTASGTQVIQWGCDGGAEQAFTINISVASSPPPTLPTPPTTVAPSNCTGDVYASVTSGSINTLAKAQAQARAINNGGAKAVTICLGQGPFTDSIQLNSQDSNETWTSGQDYSALGPETPANANQPVNRLGEVFGWDNLEQPFQVQGANNVTFSGLYIHEFTQAGILALSGTNLTITKSYFSRIPGSASNIGIVQSWGGGILIDGFGAGLKITNNDLESTGCFGINIEGVRSAVTVTGNTVNGNGNFSNGNGNNECVSIYLAGVIGGTVSGNSIRNWRNGPVLSGTTANPTNGAYLAVAIELDKLNPAPNVACSNVTVSGNYIYPPGTNGIDNGNTFALHVNNSDGNANGYTSTGNSFVNNYIDYGVFTNAPHYLTTGLNVGKQSNTDSGNNWSWNGVR